ncbi:unnamed protein product [Polarella glacialis]|uniref:Uncharacterized protein n=1 Tax=Polarella glacialis TaxID=89957 RepID=A0A813L3H6_POLGL|nr:unnamed protein product [Polarella glacialis]CAE8715702.1 unnamed protein product [Polarella glacialis]|mmetsp:Transcript_30884/g.49589  ORF Transcript_30884/g.49589 Transcript_30884/m.49589 type:complete len:143 (-) Transcript_30884:65-493(-)
MAEEEDCAVGPHIDVSSIEITPAEECAFEDGLGLVMYFSTDTYLAGYFWRVSYVVDTSKRRKIIDAGSTEPADYAPGSHAMAFSAPSMDIDSVPEDVRRQTNGLLVAALTGPNGEEAMAVNMVVQIREDEGILKRFIFNPME